MVDNFTARGWNDNLNLIVYFSIILSGIGVTWLALNNVPAGIRYITIFLVGVSFLVVSFFFINEGQSVVIKQLMKNPFTVDSHVAGGLYVLGWIIPIVISVVLSLFGQSLNIAQLMIPLSAGQVLNEISLSFTVAEAQASPFWQWFITVFTAGSIEEFVFGFVLMLVGVMIGMMVWRLLFDEKNASSETARWFYVFFGLVFTGALFGGAHFLNQSYVGYMFVVAIVFRVLMNYGVYVLGMFLSLTLGYHQSNNAIWYFKEYGANTTFNALTSIGGIIILIYFGLVLFFVFRNIDVVVGKMKKLLMWG